MWRWAWWSLLAAGCSRIEVTPDLSYDDRFDAAKLDVYAPMTGEAGRPAVVVIHGGSWADGAFGHRDVMADHAERFADAGYVAFNIEYRLTPHGGEFPHAVQDCLCALAWVRLHAAEYGVDPERVATYGYSAGGHLASMLGVVGDAPAVAPDCAAGIPAPAAAVVSGAGPQDLRLMGDAPPVQAFLGGSPSEVPQAYLDASPISYVAPGAPPFLLIDGTDDWFVPIEHARTMEAALDAVGTATRLLAIPGGGHLINRGPGGDSWDVELAIDTPEAWAAVLDFLDRTIGHVRP